jgi:hypothetical protein
LISRERAYLLRYSPYCGRPRLEGRALPETVTIFR